MRNINGKCLTIVCAASTNVPATVTEHMVWVQEHAPKDTVSCHTQGCWERRALICPRWISRYAWMWTSVQLLCHGIVPKWLRQRGGAVPCTKQWKADGQPSSGLSQVRERRVTGPFLIVLGNGASMRIKYNRKSAKTPKDLHNDSHKDQESISLQIFYMHIHTPIHVHKNARFRYCKTRFHIWEGRGPEEL